MLSWETGYHDRDGSHQQSQSQADDLNRKELDYQEKRDADPEQPEKRTADKAGKRSFRLRRENPGDGLAQELEVGHRDPAPDSVAKGPAPSPRE